MRDPFLIKNVKFRLHIRVDPSGNGTGISTKITRVVYHQVSYATNSTSKTSKMHNSVIFREPLLSNTLS